MPTIEFESDKGAQAAKTVLKKSLSAVGSSKITIKTQNNKLSVHTEDKNPAKKRASEFSSKRLSQMLAQIDKAIK